MADFYNELITILKQDGRFFSEEGQLLRNSVYEAAMQMDASLLRLLLSNAAAKARFFTEVDGVAVFDKVKFGWVINNRQFLPDSYTRFQNKIGLADENGDMISSSGRVELVFPYKDCVLEGGQTKENQKRSEIFYNESLAPDEVDRLLYPKVFTGAKRYSYVKEGADESGAVSCETITEFKNTDNLIIRGNNLLGLASLLKKFESQIQFIYIDPPYNTANDSFKYNDTFKRSTWLTFMRNRLSLAYRLLRSSGVIAISINYKEMSYLKILCDEIFGEENYISTVTVKTATTASFRAINDCPVNVSEFLLIYAKNKQSTHIEPVYVASSYSEDYGSYIENIEEEYSKWRIVSVDSIIYASEGVTTWQEYKKLHGEKWKEIRFEKKAAFCMEHRDQVVSLNTMQKPSQELVRVINQSKKDRGKVFLIGSTYVYNGRTLAFYGKRFHEIEGELIPTEILTNIWNDISFLSLGNEGGVDMPNGKKPEKLIKRLFDLFTVSGDIVMDYHLGTGTTCAVAHKVGLRYIGLEQLDYGDNDSVARLQNVLLGEQGGISQSIGWQGGGSFVYCELAKLNQAFADEIEAAENTDALAGIYKRIADTGFISCKVDPKTIDSAADEYAALSLDDQKRFLMELLDKNLLYVNLCDIDDEEFGVGKGDKAFTKSFYGEV